MKSLKILIISLSISSLSFAQSVNIGLKLESLSYFYNDVEHNTSNLFMIPIPLSGYIKASFLFNKYEIELKGGLQIDEKFAGSEYALILKYNLVGKIFPLLAYLNHYNAVGEAGMTGGSYKYNMKFVGIGSEARLTNFFGLDLIFYFPIGENKFEYSNNFSSNIPQQTTKTKIDFLIKLGFIFNVFNL